MLKYRHLFTAVSQLLLLKQVYLDKQMVGSVSKFTAYLTPGIMVLCENLQLLLIQSLRGTVYCRHIYINITFQAGKWCLTISNNTHQA